MSALEMLPVYLSYPFVQAALVVGVLVALCCSLFGMTLVLNHQSFLGDSLSHVAFAAPWPSRACSSSWTTSC